MVYIQSSHSLPNDSMAVKLMSSKGADEMMEEEGGCGAG